MLSYKNLRKLIENSPKYNSCQKINKAPVVNNGFPGKFNYSFWEPELDKLVGRNYLLPNKNLTHWKIQPCIRHLDIFNGLLEKENHYLGLFEMGALAGATQKLNISTSEKIETVNFTVKTAYDFLVKELKLDSKKIFVSVFSGGKISDVTNGKYKIDKILERDNLTYKAWVDSGLNENNIINDKSRNTLLALKLDRPCWWGYRNEILYKTEHQEKLLDIGTVEWLDMEPIFKNNEIIDVIKWPHLLAFNLVGLERILFAKNNFQHIRECDHIFPLYSEIKSNSLTKNETKIFVITEILRITHRIFSDILGYKSLSKKRKEILRKFLRTLLSYSEDIGLELSSENLTKFLKINSDLQPWYPELEKSINNSTREILDFIKRISK